MIRRNLLVCAAGCLLLAGNALALPVCTNAKLDVYLTGALAGGCTLGDLVFTNFSYRYGNASLVDYGVDATHPWGSGPVADANYPGFGVKGTGARITPHGSNAPPGPGPFNGGPNDLGVNVTVDSSTMSMSFGANWIVNRYQMVDLRIGYTVTPQTKLITQFESVYNVEKTPTPPPANTAIANPNSTVGFPVAQSGDGTNAPFNFPGAGTFGPVTVLDKIHMDANSVPSGTCTAPGQPGCNPISSQQVHLSVITDYYRQGAAPPPPTTPEPVTFALFGGGLAAMFVLQRRKRAK